MNFKVGQKVVTVTPPPSNLKSAGQLGLTIPKIGSICTIRQIRSYPTGHIGFRLCEIVNPPMPQTDNIEVYLWSACFRPLDEVAKGVTMTFEKLQSVQPIYQS